MRRLAAVATLALGAPLILSAQGEHSNFESRLLASHNRERAEVGLAPMDWNPTLAAAAGDWSDYLAATGKFEHSPDEPGQELQGENIWAGTRGYYQAEAMVGLWIEEKKDFVPGTFPQTSSTGNVADVSHYTQIIWEDSLEMGCSLSRNEAEDILVCRYARPGNIYGQDVKLDVGETAPTPEEVKVAPFRAIFDWLGIA